MYQDKVVNKQGKGTKNSFLVLYMTTKSFKLFDHIRITELNECTTLRKPIRTFCVRVIPVKVEDRKKKTIWLAE